MIASGLRKLPLPRGVNIGRRFIRFQNRTPEIHPRLLLSGGQLLVGLSMPRTFAGKLKKHTKPIDVDVHNHRLGLTIELRGVTFSIDSSADNSDESYLVFTGNMPCLNYKTMTQIKA